MILPVLKYGHPVLRQKGARVDQITPPIRKLVDDMLETMRHASGIGLAAQQVGHALQLTVIDVTGVKDRPSTLEVDGRAADLADHMPLVLINPELTPLGESVASPEGCLSFPEVFAEIARPGSVDVRAMNEKGRKVEFRCSGLLARAVQHETDHLNGILFIDRMTPDTKKDLKAELEALYAATRSELKGRPPNQ